MPTHLTRGRTCFTRRLSNWRDAIGDGGGLGQVDHCVVAHHFQAHRRKPGQSRTAHHGPIERKQAAVTGADECGRRASRGGASGWGTVVGAHNRHHAGIIRTNGHRATLMWARGAKSIEPLVVSSDDGCGSVVEGHDRHLADSEASAPRDGDLFGSDQTIRQASTARHASARRVWRRGLRSTSVGKHSGCAEQESPPNDVHGVHFPEATVHVSGF